METRHLPGMVMFSMAATVTVLGLSAWGAVRGSLESGSAQTAVCEDAPVAMIRTRLLMKRIAKGKVTTVLPHHLQMGIPEISAK